MVNRGFFSWRSCQSRCRLRAVFLPLSMSISPPPVVSFCWIPHPWNTTMFPCHNIPMVTPMPHLQYFGGMSPFLESTLSYHLYIPITHPPIHKTNLLFFGLDIPEPSVPHGHSSHELSSEGHLQHRISDLHPIWPSIGCGRTLGQLCILPWKRLPVLSHF